MDVSTKIKNNILRGVTTMDKKVKNEILKDVTNLMTDITNIGLKVSNLKQYSTCHNCMNNPCLEDTIVTSENFAGKGFCLRG